MDPAKITSQSEAAFAAAFDHLTAELSKLRTGRANAAMLDGIMVEAYGTMMPINQVGTVTAPEAQLLQVTPFDPNNLQAIAAAIRNNQSLGFNPSDDGRVVRMVIPPLTEERRREIAKQIGEKVEDAAVRMRSARHEAFRQIDAAKKDKQIGEDEAKRLEKNIDDSMGRFRQQIDAAAKTKESEILIL
jgi:ribosome recycling factor